ncbi:MAG TPA: pyridoxal-phosphate dependent enzyme [Gaiellaceae bacterium]|nr:pyridoxal-phosphate dependent enzyme [Gaiellaceae bacterium]
MSDTSRDSELTQVVERADVEAARDAIAGRLHRTPTVPSATLGELTGACVFLKAELFQKTGSFKPRGVLTNLAALTAQERERGVIGISAGNHAQALAWGAAAEGIDALLVMWQGASEAKIAATRGYGAAVDLESRDPAEAFGRLDELVEETGRALVHPFDHPRTIAGQGTVGLEVLEDVPDADVVVVPIGGGGLIAGIATAVDGRARVIGVEPESSAAMFQAARAREPVPLAPTSVADGLNAPFAGTNTLAVVLQRVDELVLVSEAEIEEGMRFLYARAKLACEPAGAAATAALLAGKVPLEQGETVVAIVSGGNVASETAAAILAGR